MNAWPESALNFRSLGGIPTENGKTVRDGVLYRAGDMGALRSACRARMRSLGIRTFVDLRSDKERKYRPYDWDRDAEFELWNHAAETSDASIRALIAAARTTREQVVEAMKRLYRALPTSHANSYARIFAALARGRGPVLFACAAGKDRTGVGAALVLWSLGVGREAIVEDYLRTNACQSALESMVNAQFAWDTDSAPVKAVLTARREYLDAMFDEVETRWGNIENYLKDQLQVDESTLRGIRERILE